MTGFVSLLQAAAMFRAMQHDMEVVTPAIVARACEMICAEAKRVIGKGCDDWPALSPTTLARKIGKGPICPLLPPRPRYAVLNASE